MKRGGPLKRRKPIPKRRTKPRVRKSVVRLVGTALEALRRLCFDSDWGLCQKCGARLFFEARFDGDPLAFDMAHCIGRGASGSDVITNVISLCHADHIASHSGKFKLPRSRAELPKWRKEWQGERVSLR